MPAWVKVPGEEEEGQTRGPPPSPSQVSWPDLPPPAHMKEGSSLNLEPSRLARNFSWQTPRSTTGISSSFRTTWYWPSAPYLSFPHPVAKQDLLSKFSPGWGRQTVSTL